MESLSDSKENFLGFGSSDIYVREIDFESDEEEFDNSISSVRMSDLSDLGERDSESRESDVVDEGGASGDARGWKTTISNLQIEAFREQKGPYVTVSDKSLYFSFYFIQICSLTPKI